MTDHDAAELSEIDQLRAELADATARANALDVRASAAERVAKAAHDAAQTGQVLKVRGSELTNAMELWDRVQKQDHPTRARDYAEAVTQLAQAREWMPELDDEMRADITRNALLWGETPAEYIRGALDQYLTEYGHK